ncbi:hypothetical protein POVWA2_042780 [Plasmodium ovale wallikeri]|uniref:Uncharacterized protein n=1 Tax=Plasmodium ovale wallikeri TaxID=864142 RepID=A0A1A8ZDK1_PLAOA|nr:hypothetical protein POVWA1_044180 [Plasmodium ovale wallikeri]SBT41967.1 hypothetical protein POVWA2_042780 [Plasmodium ovale wallikeri]
MQRPSRRRIMSKWSEITAEVLTKCEILSSILHCVGDTFYYLYLTTLLCKRRGGGGESLIAGTCTFISMNAYVHMLYVPPKNLRQKRDAKY